MTEVRLCANCIYCGKMPTPVGVRNASTDYWCSRFKKVATPSSNDCKVHILFRTGEVSNGA